MNRIWSPSVKSTRLNVPVKVMKDAIYVVSLPLASIFSSSLQNGTFPKMYKVAIVTPIFKSDQRTDVNNY